MAKIEAIQFQDSKGVEVTLSYGRPSRAEGIIFHRKLERSTPASIISGIFWEEPAALQDLVRGVKEFSENNPLDSHKARLLRIAVGRIEEFIKATRFYPPED